MNYGEAGGTSSGMISFGQNHIGNFSGSGLNGNSGTTDENSFCNTSITKANPNQAMQMKQSSSY
jgi:hypothetical protein